LGGLDRGAEGAENETPKAPRGGKWGGGIPQDLSSYGPAPGLTPRDSLRTVTDTSENIHFYGFFNFLFPYIFLFFSFFSFWFRAVDYFQLLSAR